MTIRPSKPKLLFFQQRCNEHLPAFLLLHKREHVKCLAHFFDVTVIRGDCDYRVVCEKHEPALTLFESGAAFPTSERLQIRNAHSCRGIPKLGFLHADAFCHSRTAFISDMDSWGIDTFVTIATTAAEHTPAIADALFVWPNFADTDLYHDYGEWKSIPVLFTGASTAPYYPWRQKIARLIANHYPSLTWGHPGYLPLVGTTHTISGETYARTLNASWFVPTCGSLAKDLVRKHLEIPASKACLITEESPVLRAAGFIDMKNCIFASERDVLDKLAYLLANPDRLQEIIDAGYRLVHSHHSIRDRNQIFQWFELHKQLKANQRVVQPGPFEPLRIVDTATGKGNHHIVSNGQHLTLMKQGDERLWRGQYEQAEVLYIKCATYFPRMPEPQLRIALCNLYKGKPRLALTWILKPLEFTLAQYNAADPDPVEWAYLVLSLICLGRLDDASKRSSEYQWLRHPELDRVRWLTSLLQGSERVSPLERDEVVGERRSIHQLPPRSLDEWVWHIQRMLRASGKNQLAERLGNYEKNRATWSRGHKSQDHNAAVPTKSSREFTMRPTNATDSCELHHNLAFDKRRLFCGWDTAGCGRRVGAAFKRPLKQMLHSLEAKYGYFLPYSISASRNDDFFYAIRELTRKHDIRTVLIIGANVRQYSTAALFAGALENDGAPLVFCIELFAPWHAFAWTKAPPSDAHICWYTASRGPQRPAGCSTEAVIQRILKEHQIGCFDAILIDGSEVTERADMAGGLEELLLQAKLVFLDDINTAWNQKRYYTLICNPHYQLLQSNPELRNGQAIFARESLSASTELAPLTFTVSQS